MSKLSLNMSPATSVTSVDFVQTGPGIKSLSWGILPFVRKSYPYSLEVSSPRRGYGSRRGTGDYTAGLREEMQNDSTGATLKEDETSCPFSQPQ